MSKAYEFVNNEGKIISVPGNTTIPDLLKMGVKKVSFEDIGTPPPKDKQSYIHKPTV